MTSRSWDEMLQLYDKLIATSDKFERKGKTMPYTSVNGHMYSQLNKAGQLGIRLSVASGAEFVKKYGASTFTSYGAVMKEYVCIPDSLLDEPEVLRVYLEEAHHYAMSLKPKK